MGSANYYSSINVHRFTLVTLTITLLFARLDWTVAATATAPVTVIDKSTTTVATGGSGNSSTTTTTPATTSTTTSTATVAPAASLETKNQKVDPVSTTESNTVPINVTSTEIDGSKNDTDPHNAHKSSMPAWLNKFGITEENSSTYLRAFYVVIAVTGVIVIYLGVKTVMVRRRKKKSRHYDVLDEEHLRLNNLDDEEEEDLFNQSHRRLI